MKVMSTNYKTVLFTEANGSICYELSRLFARKKYNVVLISRSGLALSMLTEELHQLGAPRVEVIHSDLSKPRAAQELYDEVQELGLSIEVLVNDSSLGEHGLFYEMNIEKMLAIIQFNITSLVYLTRLFLSDMIAAGSGRILQVGSIASSSPTPYLAVYAATKAFVLNFSNSLINELEGTGVTMTTLIPSENDFNLTEDAAKAGEDCIDPKELAQKCFEGLMSGVHHVDAGVSVHASIFLSAMKP